MIQAEGIGTGFIVLRRRSTNGGVVAAVGANGRMQK